MKTAQKVLGLVLGIMVFGYFGVAKVNAAQITNFNVLMSDTRPITSSTYRFQWTTATTATLEEIEFHFCTLPSDTCLPPAGLVTSTALKSTITGLTGAEWSLNALSNAVPRLQHVSGSENVTENTIVSVLMSAITNNPTTSCDATESSDTCFVRLYTFDDKTLPVASAVDEGVASYTVVATVQVTARVDPAFTFVVSGVNSATVHNSITTSVTSTYSTLPFSNLTIGTPKYVAHGLNVTTNTEAGYTVSMYLTQQMIGVYSGNNIDPFISTWGTPTTWTEPTGNLPNDNTGWLGANTTDTDVSGFSASPQGKFGPVTNASNMVMSGAGSDNGANAVYVSYGIEVNVFQPADTYTGTLFYIALPRY